MDRGARRVTVHGVTKSWTQLKRLNTHACSVISGKAGIQGQALQIRRRISRTHMTVSLGYIQLHKPLNFSICFRPRSQNLQA